MTEKRYYKKDWEESYYIFDSNTISEDEFEERVEYEGYDVFGDSLTGDEVIDLLNENEELKQFKEKAFEIINKTIEREIIIAENIEKTTHSPPGSAINRGTISTLENLKMELEE